MLVKTSLAFGTRNWVLRLSVLGLLTAAFVPFAAAPAQAVVPCGGGILPLNPVRLDSVAVGQSDGYHQIQGATTTYTLVGLTGAANLIVYNFSVGCAVILCSKANDDAVKQCQVPAGHHVVEVQYRSSVGGVDVNYALRAGSP